MNIAPSGLGFNLPLDAVLSIVTNAINRGRIFLAPTPGTEFISDALVDLIKRGKRGMATGAETTFGKTQCLTLILSTASTELGAEIYHGVVYDFKGSSWESLLLDIASALGLTMTSRSAIKDRVDAIILVLYEFALRSPYRTVILAIDEAQRLSAKQVQGLKMLGNLLDRLQCTMFLWLVGQESVFEIGTTLEESVPGEVDQLKERFMYNYRLPGISTKAQLEIFLIKFDQAEFPNGYSVVGRYIPRAVGAGFRIASVHAIAWKVIVEVASSAMAGEVEIGIGHTVEMLSGYLTRASKQDQTNFSTENAEELLTKALVETGFRDQIRSRAKRLASTSSGY